MLINVIGDCVGICICDRLVDHAVAVNINLAVCHIDQKHRSALCAAALFPQILIIQRMCKPGGSESFCIRSEKSHRTVLCQPLHILRQCAQLTLLQKRSIIVKLNLISGLIIDIPGSA